jgi:hypothetical protein
VLLSNDSLPREAFSTHPLFSGSVFQKEKEKNGKVKIVNRE